MNAMGKTQEFGRNMSGYYLVFWSFAFFCLLPLCLAARVEAAPLQPVSIINVLVLYTPQASAGAGGTSSMLHQINTAVMEANTVFQNSQINARINLAHAAEINYRESGSVSNDLSRLRNPGNGVLAEAHKLRDQFNADLVCLITETGSDLWFYGLQGPSPDNAFSIVRRPYLTGGYYFPVALSFNFGCQLEPAYADSVGAFPYAYGYSFWGYDAFYSTVEGFSGQRIPFFSNPDIMYQGVPIGIPAGQLGAADNALVINQTAPIVAAFRGSASVTILPAISITSPVEASTFQAGSNIVLTVNATDADGKVVRVDYYYDGTNMLASEVVKPFTAVWRSVPMGEHSLFAVATDNAGATTISDPIHITVPPANDNFAGRSKLTGSSCTVHTSNALATAEPGEPDHAGLPAAYSLWWTYTAPANGVVTLDATRSSFDASLDVYTGNALDVLTEVTSTIWAPESAVRFQVAAGQNYQIAVDSADGETGNIELGLRFAPFPANDNFANRQQLNGNHIKVHADNRGATTEVSEENQYQLQGIASLWWTWTAPADGEFTLSLTGAASTNLWSAVFTGNALGDLAQVTFQYYDPMTFVMTAEKGVSYQIFEGSTGGALSPGPFDLNLDFLPEQSNDRFAKRTPIHGASINLSNSITGATFEPGTPASNYGYLPTIWWSWTAPFSGYVTIVCPSGQNIDVFTG